MIIILAARLYNEAKANLALDVEQRRKHRRTTENNIDLIGLDEKFVFDVSSTELMCLRVYVEWICISLLDMNDVFIPRSPLDMNKCEKKNPFSEYVFNKMVCLHEIHSPLLRMRVCKTNEIEFQSAGSLIVCNILFFFSSLYVLIHFSH